jgi:hypothetical protein
MADEMDQQERQALYFKPAEIILVELMKSTFYLDTTYNTQQTKSNVNQLHIIIERKLNVVIIQQCLSLLLIHFVGHVCLLIKCQCY